MRSGYRRALLAILQENPGRTTPVFASVHTLAVLAILRSISQMEIGGNRRLVCQKAKRTEVNGGAAVHLNHWRRSSVLLLRL